MSNESREDSAEADSTLNLSVKNDKIELIGQLHGLILFTIASTYYKDCLTIVFFIRTFSQIQIASAGVRFVLTAFAISFLTHLLHALPEPGNSNNTGSAYGLIVDFVGEVRPWRIGLLLLDVLVLALQLLYLAIIYKNASPAPHDHPAQQSAETPQDIEAEEAGISRSDAHRHDGNDIEMQALLPDGSGREHESPKEEDNMIHLGRQDLYGIFRNPASSTTQSAESPDALQRFISRVNAVRARREQEYAAAEAAAERAAAAARARLATRATAATTSNPA